jgi:Flp pilus assembly protein TadG
MISIEKLVLRFMRQESGASILETAFIVPFMFLLISGAVDFGRAYYTAIEVSSASHVGALYGVQNPTDTSGMQTAANNDAPDISGMTSTAIYGCECADGTSSVASCTYAPSCSDNYVVYVSVTSTKTFTPLIKYPGIPSTIVLSKTTTMRAGGD